MPTIREHGREPLSSASDSSLTLSDQAFAALEALPGVGKVKAKRTMEDIGISESRRVRGLGDQQRAALLKTFPG